MLDREWKHKRLYVPEQWKDYWSAYPQGYTILEALIDWVHQVNNMADNLNDFYGRLKHFRKEIDNFKKRFDDNLQEEVERTLSDWQESGFLEIVIDQALETKYHEMDERLSTQLEKTENDLKSRAINVMFPPPPFNAPNRDGVTDDSLIIQAIYDSLNDGDTLEIPAGEYKIDNTLVFDKQVNVIGHKGQTKFISDSNAYVLFSGKPQSKVYTITQTPIGNTITLSDTTHIKKGQLLVIKDKSQIWEIDTRDGQRYGELNIVKEVRGDVVELEIETSSVYNINTEVTPVDALENLKITGLSFFRKERTSNNEVALVLSYTKNCQVDEIFIDGYGGGGVMDNYSYGNNYSRISANNGFYSGSSTGYGFQTNGSVFTQINESLFMNYRRGTDFSGDIPTRFATVKNSTVIGTTQQGVYDSGFGGHGTSEYCLIDSCRVIGCSSAYLLRGNHIKLKDCVSYKTRTAFAVCTAGYDHVIENSGAEDFVPIYIHISSPDYENNPQKSIRLKGLNGKYYYNFIEILEDVKSSNIYLDDISPIAHSSGVSLFVKTSDSAPNRTFQLFLNNVNIYDRYGNKLYYPIEEGNNTSIMIKNKNVRENINQAPTFIGEIAVVNGVAYIATGNSSPSDWKQITN